MKRCFSCFKLFDDEYTVCPHCGQIEITEPEQPIYLYPGTVLADRYIIGHSLGAGGFGIVYNAWDSKLETVVAIKEFFVTRFMTRASGENDVIVTKKAHNEYEYRKARFLAEARNMAKFGSHKSIPNVFEFFEENETAYIVMELLHGISLKDYILENDGKVDVAFATMVATEVGNALKSLHKENIIHRDVAPDNIFICTKNEIRVKLMDLGAAKLADNTDDVIDIVLKPGYAPPEQYEKNENISPSMDMYALGATLYVMLTGKKPDESTNRKNRIEMNEEDSVVPESVAEAEQLKLEAVKEKLLRHHNVIITGVTGTGKSLLANKLADDPFFAQTAKMFWHSSTDYTDTIEGISAVLTDDGKINYAILPGMIKQLADSPVKGPKLMIIEGINKCNPAEALGELITLLEADKRNLHIEGYDGDIQIPEDMYFLCTINPNIENQFKLDSAMKRRFVIANLYPDYDLLALHLNVTNETIDPDEFVFEDLDNSDVKKLAVQVLKKVNNAIAFSVGTNYQIGHAVFWNIPIDSKLSNLLEMFDNIVLPQIEDLCFDADVARKIFGDDSPAISILPYGVEVHRLSSLTPADQIEALKGLLSHD